MSLGVTTFDPQSQYLFGREYSVIFGPPGQSGGKQFGNIGQNPSPLRVSFDIDKNMYSTPNKSKIELYNLQPESRGAIQKGYLVILQAGYRGLTKNLFIGNVLTQTSKRSGADIITSVECLDGASSITMAKINKSYPAGVKLVQVLEDIAKAMMTTTTLNPSPISPGVAIGIPDQTYNKGLTLHTTCAAALTKLLKPQGLEWNVQNGTLNIVPLKKTINNSAFVVSIETGMIDVPSENNQLTQFKSLLNPNLTPGSYVQLKSENVKLNGFYKIRRSHYEGDTHDNKWQVTCECSKISAAVIPEPAAQGTDYTGAVTA